MGGGLVPPMLALFLPLPTLWIGVIIWTGQSCCGEMLCGRFPHSAIDLRVQGRVCKHRTICRANLVNAPPAVC